jgi:hypothetical protein
MVDKMDVQDSAQRIAPPRSQQTASSTGDSLQLSMMRTVSNLLNVRSLAFHHAYGRMCLCSYRPVRVLTLLLRGSGRRPFLVVTFC